LNRQSVTISDIYADPRIPVTAYRSTFVKSLLMVPIGAADPVGALGAYWATHHQADQRERLLLETIAGFTSVAVANARLYQEARDAVRARDEWLAVASHELKTPLTPIALQLRTTVGALKQDEVPRDRVLTQAQRKERSVSRLSRLAEQLLDYSRFSSSELTIEPASCDLAALAADVCDHFRLDPRLAGAKLHLHAPSAVLGAWDKLRLEEVLVNLLSNAAKYGGGEPVAVDVRADVDSARLAVTDRGPGIPVEHHERIFQPFARLDPHEQGVGLGLWIVHKIVRAHEGKIEVRSQPGQGTTMVVVLPLDVQAPPGRPHSAN
jgi:signal transduction histidine kinase